jgi:hypothetical protein
MRASTVVKCQSTPFCFRFDTPAEREALAAVYAYLCPLYNYWHPSFRLTGKEKRMDGRYQKIYEKIPKTPYERLLESSEVSEESETELRRRKNGYNPVELNSRLNGAVERLLKINREKDTVKQAFREGAGQAEAV